MFQYSFVVLCLNIFLRGPTASGSVTKRGAYDDSFDNGFPANDLGFNGAASHFGAPGAPIIYAKPVVIQKVGGYPQPPPVSPAEIASAISAAKEASASVQQAQHRVQLAKESVLQQQRIASHKEAQAALAAQKAEAAAAVQRQEAHAAATALVMAQQRLAHAKADVAEQQRLASAKESHAAHVIQKSAAAAAAEIHKSEVQAAKLAALQRSEQSAYKHASAAKEATLSAASAAVAASNSHAQHPWAPNAFLVGHWH